MSIELTEQQQQALDESPETEPAVIDPRNHTTYILVPASEYESVREIIEDERRRRAIAATALRNAVGRMQESA